jgi:hypothetical protein
LKLSLTLQQLLVVIIVAIIFQIFGMNLVEIEHSSSMKQYILVNSEQFAADVSNLKWPNEVEAQQVLLMLVLSLIFMSGGVVKDGMRMYADINV